MHKLTEDLLHFIWKHKLLQPGHLATVSGKSLRILQTGEHNLHAGPDFFNARIELNGFTLVGNLEIHIRSSDWNKHGHQSDPAYNQLILHVVYEHDVTVQQNVDHGVEVLELKSHIAPSTLEQYQHLGRSAAVIPCGPQLHRLELFRFNSWVERMAVERLETKINALEELFRQSNHDYTVTFYKWLMRAFGLPVNKVPFETLAASMPLTLLLRYNDDPIRVEALLLGMAGLLEKEPIAKKKRVLINEFAFLSSKHQLIPLNEGIFKFARMRPPDFPDKRLRQITQLICFHTSFITHPHEVSEIKGLKTALQSIGAGEGFISRIIINAYVPWLFFYGKRLMHADYQQQALKILEQCAPENNAKTRCFTGMQSHVGSAVQSQGLLHLYDNYCTRKRCLFCGIAASLLKPANLSPNNLTDS